MRVCVNHSKVIDKEMKNRLNVILDIFKYIGDPVSIILAGAYGKGEGSVKVLKGKVVLLNDFDIFVFFDKKINRRRLKKIVDSVRKKVISGSLSNKELEIDVRFLEKRKLPELLPILRFYELKYASILLYGDDVRRTIPSFRKGDLPAYEGFRLLFNRICFFSDWFSIGKLKSEDKLIFETAKNYVICCSALNILYKDHEPRLALGIKKLKNNLKKYDPDFYKKNMAMIKRMEYFINLKLNPKLKKPKYPKKEWFDSLNFYKEIIELFQKKFTCSSNWNEFLKKTSKIYMLPYINYGVKRKFKVQIPKFLSLCGSYAIQSYRTFRWFLKIVKTQKKFYFPILKDFRDPVLRIYTAALFTLFSIENNRINKDNFGLAQKYISGIYPYKVKGGDTKTRYNNFLRYLANAHELILGMKPVGTIKRNKISVIFRNIN